MEIVKYLNACITDSALDTLDELLDDLSIKYSHNVKYPELYILNYDQIKSSKHHPITLECRSLVVEFIKMGEWKVVSRSFDRFFNYGETETAYNASFLTAHEKMDGSLINLFYHPKYKWLYRTRSMLMPVTNVNAMDLTWDVLIEESLGTIWSDRILLHPSYTIIMEVTSPDNRVVTRYANRNMNLLSIRHTDGTYYNNTKGKELAKEFGWSVPSTWAFTTMTDCVLAAKELRDLNEGYVMYNQRGEPVCKVKNPAYVAAHHLRGEGVLTPKRVMDLIIMNELSEYLSVFPEDEYAVEPYQYAMDEMWAHAKELWKVNGNITDQKEFALAVKDTPVSSLLFKRKGGMHFNDAFNALNTNSKYAVISNYISKEGSI